MGTDQARGGARQVLRAGAAPLLTTVVLSYVFAQVAPLVAANLARAVVILLLNVFADGVHGPVPHWVGVTSWLVGLGFLAVAIAAAVAALLTGTVETTRSVRSGEDVRPWTPFRRGLHRVPAVTRSLLLLVPSIALVTAVALLLVAASFVLVPIALVVGLVALVRPSSRRRWMRIPAVLAVPLGLLVAVIARWALWLPFVVVDGDSTRHSLRSSSRIVRERWIDTMRPFAIVTAPALVGFLAAAVAAANGAGAAASIVSLLSTIELVLGWTIIATLVHEERTGATPVPRDRVVTDFAPGFRPSPGLIMLIVVALLGQSFYVGRDASPAAADAIVGTYVVNTLADDLNPDLGTECLTPEATCTLRGAVGQLMANPIPGGTITFDVSGDILLQGVLQVRQSMIIDGAGQQVVLHRTFDNNATLFLGAPPGGEGGGGEGPPPEGGGETPGGPPNVDITLRNLTVFGPADHMGRGLMVSAGTVTLDHMTFEGNLMSDVDGPFFDEPGAAIYNSASLTVRNSTFKDNAGAPGTGGTIWSVDSTGHGSLDVVNSTFFDNHGGGVGWSSGTILLANNVFQNGDGGFNCQFGAGTQVGNLSNDGSCSDDPTRTSLTPLQMGLADYANHGGSVPTVALFATSAAIGAADPTYCPVDDARGEARPTPPTPCDVGAYQSSGGTTTTATAPTDPVAYGETVNVTVTVTHPVAAPQGTVQLTGVPGEPLTGTLSAGTTTIPVTGLSVGAHTITATYVPSGPLTGSSDTVDVTIAKQVSHTVLAVDPSGGTSVVGAPVSLSATVTNGGNISGPVPTGTVSFLDGTTEVANVALTDGTADAGEVTLGGGLHHLTASYSGDAGFETSVSVDHPHAVQNATTIDLTAPSSIQYGEAHSLIVTVGPSGGGIPDPTGTVTVTATTTDGLHGYTAGFGTLSGGTVTIAGSTTLPVGDYHLIASFPGDSDHSAAVSAASDLTVNAADTTTSLTGPAGPTVSGQAATFTATVTAAGSTATPAGDVAFSVDGTVMATVPTVAGVATYAPDDLHAGAVPHVVVATFTDDDGQFDTSTSGDVVHTVNVGQTTTNLTAPSASVTGQSVTLTATVSPVAPATGTPAGTVTFRADGNSLGTVTLAAGSASVSTSALTVGGHSLTADFNATTDLQGSSATAVSHTVSKASTTVTLTSNPTTPGVGDPVALTATAAAVAPGGGSPDGSVTFTDGATTLGTIALSGGTAVLSLPSLGGGAHSLTASYGGSTSYSGDTDTLALTVTKASSSLAIASVSPEPSRYGDPVTMVAHLTTGGPQPTGLVEFFWGGNGNSIGTAPVNASGDATLVVADLTPTRTTVSAHFLGDADHLDAFTPTGSDNVLTYHEVKKAVPQLAITSETNPTAYGEQIKVNVDVTKVLGHVPGGTVRIRLSGTPADEDRVTTFDASGHAQGTFFPDTVGDLTIFVTTSSDFWFDAVVLQQGSHHVNPGTASVTLQAAANPVVGTPTALTATVGPAAAAGIGSVHFKEGATELASVVLGNDGKATANVTFSTKGTHTITAVYDGGYGPFAQVSSSPLALDVAGKPLTTVVVGSSSTWGAAAALNANLFTTDTTGPTPTGTVTVKEGSTTLGSVPLGSNVGSSGFWVFPTAVPLGTGLEPGSHPITVTYSGDSTYAGVTQSTTFLVQKRTVSVQIDPPIPGAPVAGDPTILSGRLVGATGWPAPATGSLTLGSGSASCVVPLLDGAIGGSCQVHFPVATTEVVYARYSGDTHFNEATSAQRLVTVQANRAFVHVDTTHHASGTWTNAEPVTVTWTVTGNGITDPTGSVSVYTNEGYQSCTAILAGSCQIRFANPTDAAWVEVRYGGSSTFAPSVGRVDGRVLGCFNVTMASGGTNLTAPNCAGSKFLAGTPIDLVAAPRTGYQFVGWHLSTLPDIPYLPSPVFVRGNTYIEPRYSPQCVTLRASYYPANLPHLAPEPAPNCDDLVDPNGNIRDLDAIAAREVASGSMRYRVGTVVTLPVFSIKLNVGADGLIVPTRWTGDGVTVATNRTTVTMDQDRDVAMGLDLPCRSVVLDGPPGSQVALASSTLDTSKSSLINGIVGGRCNKADGTPGYLTGTTIRVQMDTGTSTWFDHFGPLERLAGHRAPTGITVVTDRPATAVTRGTTSFVVPDYDVAMSGFASGVVCYELTLELHDAVTPGNLQDGSKPASATATAPNCPSFWLTENKVDTTAHPRWYLPGTAVALTADNSTRRGYVDEYAAPKQIFFRGWTGDVSATTAATTVTMNAAKHAVASWYVGAACANIVARAIPSTGGDVVIGGIDDQCPNTATVFAGTRVVARARLGSTLSFAARPKGSLQTIWQVEGPSVSNTEACRTREEMIQEKYDDGAAQGKTRAEIDFILMQQGYIPGYINALIQREAKWRFERGYTQDQIVGDLKTLGYLTADGAMVPDRLRDNPCDKVQRNTVVPAGQRVITLQADGDQTYTAWFCQAVVPSVTVIELDGTKHVATGTQLNQFASIFKSSNADANCPTEGFFLPGTTAVLGGNGSGVPGYAIDSWRLDGAAKPAGSLSVPISTDGAPHQVAVTVKVVCQKLTVTAEFGSTSYPLPNCPGVDAARKLYAKDTKVTVTAGEESNHVFQGWNETGNAFNPTLATMDKDVTLTARFRSKTVGEQIQDTVIDPALNALGVAAKKAVGGVAYLTKIFAQTVIEDGVLKGLSLIGTGLKAGFNALGVDGVVLDGIALGLQTPANSFEAGLAGFDCVEEWAWGRSVPTLDDLQDTVKDAVSGEAIKTVQGIKVDDIVNEAYAYQARIEAGDATALAELTVLAGSGGQAAMALALVQDIEAHPDAWKDRATAAANYGLKFLEDQFGKPFTWETSASEAWTSGGDAFLSCMAENGRDMAGQGLED